MLKLFSASWKYGLRYGVYINPLAPEFFLIFAHPVFKMWIIQEPNQVELWNKRHFEEKETEIMQHV
jgi:hypothetical protein